MSKVGELPFHAKDLIESQDEIFHKEILGLADDAEELMRFGNWNWDSKTEILKWSRGMYILMDFNPDVQGPEITMEFLRSHILAEDREQMKMAFDKAVANKDKTLEFNYTVITNQQKEKNLHSKGKIIYDNRGDVKNILGFTRDITESTQLLNTLNNYKQLVEEREGFLGHGSWEWDLIDKKAVWWSDGMYHLFGYDPDQKKSEVRLNEDLYKFHLTQETFDKARTHLNNLLKNGDNRYFQVF